MKIYRRRVWDIETGRVLEEDFYNYTGPIAEAKGGGGGNMPNIPNGSLSSGAGSLSAGGMNPNASGGIGTGVSLHPAVMTALQQYHPEIADFVTNNPHILSSLPANPGRFGNISPPTMSRPTLGASMFGANLSSLRAPLSGNMPQRSAAPTALGLAINRRFGG